MKSVVSDVPLFYYISTILAHRDVFRQIKGLGTLERQLGNYRRHSKFDLQFFSLLNDFVLTTQFRETEYSEIF